MGADRAGAGGRAAAEERRGVGAAVAPGQAAGAWGRHALDGRNPAPT